MSKEKGLPLTSNHWGTYRAKVEDGKVKAVESDSKDIEVIL